MTTTTSLAERARAIAETNPTQRRAALCAAVVLEDARTISGARRMLQAADIDRAVREAAIALIDQLTTEET